MAHLWKIITSRHDNLHPYAQVISRLSLSVVIYVALRSYIFGSNSYIPTIILVFMIASSFRSAQTNIAQLIMPAVSSERQGILSAVAAFDAYKDNTNAMIRRRYALFAKMPIQHRKIATDVGYLDRLQAMEKQIAANARVINGLSRFAKKKHNIKEFELRTTRPLSNISVIELLHHYVRDWSSDLASERTELFNPLLTSLSTEFSPESRSSKNVLVPGSGLARAAYDISQLGFQTQALEYSHLMDIAAQFVYDFKGNLTGADTGFEYFPYVHEFSHQASTESQLRGVCSPDVSGIKQPKNLTLGYGDFTELSQTKPDHFDAVVSLFLIDTAENAMKYLDAIRVLLKPGGIWINYGPLKWGSAPQVEFNLEELELVISKLGFTIEKQFKGSNEYNGDRKSLWHGAYEICGWVARKNA